MSITNYKFPDLSDSVEKELAIILGKITHHIHPDIVEFITEENLSYKERFESVCHKSCDINSFFYPGSDCVFPGFRRPINKEKTKGWKNNIYEKDGTILNDNTFPRHIWAYLSMNKAYSGGATGMWSPSGLDRFELAHIFGHKQDERELEKTADFFNNEKFVYELTPDQLAEVEEAFLKISPGDCDRGGAKRRVLDEMIPQDFKEHVRQAFLDMLGETH